ncbi:volume-regulated anion channel subunit LRRC8D [Neosynchiropus ocellatus]
MFTLSELAPLNQHHSRSKLLKPWWEVFMDHLVVLMLVTSILACTEQLSRDRVVCVPSDDGSERSAPPPERHNILDSDFLPAGPGRQTELVFQQYVFIGQVCYHEALPFCSRFLPQLALLQTLLLVASGSFWLHFPRTSSCVEQFLAILAKCCESPWTSQALSLAARQEALHHCPRRSRPVPPPGSPGMTRTRQSSTDSLLPATAPTGPAPPAPEAAPPAEFETSRPRVSLDRSDGEQARALFERVRKFRSHCEPSTVIYKVYLTQTVFKIVAAALILSYTVPLLLSFTFTHNCVTREGALVGYLSFSCIHVLSSLLHKLMVAYALLLGLYGLLNLYTLLWILRRSASFSQLPGDVPAPRRDLAFLLHMLDQYDPLLVQHLSVFLSPAHEGQLMDESFESRWSEDKLQAMLRVDTEGRSQLELVALARLPAALFSLSKLEVLKVEHVTEVRFTAQVSNMTSLRELHLQHCAASVDSAALTVLQERLEVLHLTFTQASEMPDWVLSLHSLQELHLRGRLGGEGRSWALGSVRQLRHLRVLALEGKLQRIPAELCDVSDSLVKLELHSDGAKVLSLTALKRLVNLSELLLQDCQLERLPSSLMSLTKLRTLKLQRNDLSNLEGLVVLSHLQRLSSLRLAFNNIQVIPSCVAALQGLELLDLSNNRLKNLPSSLFKLRRLRRLFLSNNVLRRLPADVRALTLLSELDLSGNLLESLPCQMFQSCLELCTLNVAHNSLKSLPGEIASSSQLSKLDLRFNSLQELPAELGCCPGLHGGGLLVEYRLFVSLPLHVRSILSAPCASFDSETVQEEADKFPLFSPTQWRFSSAPESQL